MSTPVWSSKLVIRLVRGLPGTREIHRRTVRAIGLRKVNQIVVRENTPSMRGMINQVKRLLDVETVEMYEARLKEQAERRAFRPPIVMKGDEEGAMKFLQQIAKANGKALPPGRLSAFLPTTGRYVLPVPKIFLDNPFKETRNSSNLPTGKHFPPGSASAIKLDHLEEMQYFS